MGSWQAPCSQACALGGGSDTLGAAPVNALAEIPALVDRTYREEYGRIVAHLLGILGDFELAEDLTTEAFTSALERWPRDGVPARPGAWLTTVARNRARDRLRRRQTAVRKAASVGHLQDLGEAERAARALDEIESPLGVPDERLRLIFICCHPSLPEHTQVALTLRTLGGLSTAEIARAFLVSESTMAQRLVRAKKRLAAEGVPYEIPDRAQLGARLRAVLHVVYLIFNEGYAASEGDELLRAELCGEALRLAELLARLGEGAPAERGGASFGPVYAEVLGLWALMSLHHSRRHTRVDSEGDVVLLEEQARERWDREAIARGLELLDRALSLRAPGPYQIQAAIAALHAQAPSPGDTDWAQIAALYGSLAHLQPSPVIELNRAVAVAMAEGPAVGLALLDALEARGELASYHLLPAARADLLRRAGRYEAARKAYERALSLAGNAAERRFLARRIEQMRDENP